MSAYYKDFQASTVIDYCLSAIEHGRIAIVINNFKFKRRKLVSKNCKGRRSRISRDNISVLQTLQAKKKAQMLQ